MGAQQNLVDIVHIATTNAAFRRVVLTGEHEQVVVMTIPLGGEIGEEVHEGTDQVLLFLQGHGEMDLDGVVSSIGPNDLVFVRAGVRHNFMNTGDGPMRLVTIYSPPEHAPGTVHMSQREAVAAGH